MRTTHSEFLGQTESHELLGSIEGEGKMAATVVCFIGLVSGEGRERESERGGERERVREGRERE